MSDAQTATPAYGDALTAPFWEAAARHELLLQRCNACGHWQFYPRPFCLECYSHNVGWQPASGSGTVYSQTTVHIQVAPDLPPPYVVAVVALAEGPRLTTHIVNGTTEIGDAVRVTWRERADAPPLPVFEPVDRAVSGER
ncbi:MAG: hypothetical protein DCC58_08325 [Chloroflexi bacterium]|nr:MAG: hypothetical protein DCC58_08325 [Chloroflexota bacterium]